MSTYMGAARKDSHGSKTTKSPELAGSTPALLNRVDEAGTPAGRIVIWEFPKVRGT